jgi:hypothetical protein
MVLSCSSYRVGIMVGADALVLVKCRPVSSERNMQNIALPFRLVFLGVKLVVCSLFSQGCPLAALRQAGRVRRGNRQPVEGTWGLKGT